MNSYLEYKMCREHSVISNPLGHTNQSYVELMADHILFMRIRSFAFSETNTSAIFELLSLTEPYCLALTKYTYRSTYFQTMTYILYPLSGVLFS